MVTLTFKEGFVIVGLWRLLFCMVMLFTSILSSCVWQCAMFMLGNVYSAVSNREIKLVLFSSHKVKVSISICFPSFSHCAVFSLVLYFFSMLRQGSRPLPPMSCFASLLFQIARAEWRKQKCIVVECLEPRCINIFRFLVNILLLLDCI